MISTVHGEETEILYSTHTEEERKNEKCSEVLPLSALSTCGDTLSVFRSGSSVNRASQQYVCREVCTL